MDRQCRWTAQGLWLADWSRGRAGVEVTETENRKHDGLGKRTGLRVPSRTRQLDVGVVRRKPLSGPLAPVTLRRGGTQTEDGCPDCHL